MRNNNYRCLFVIILTMIMITSKSKFTFTDDKSESGNLNIVTNHKISSKKDKTITEQIPALNVKRTISSDITMLEDDIIKNLKKSVPKSARVAYLTFDDGLDNHITPKILDVLKDNDIKATFFVIGNTLEKNRDLLKRIIEEGHSIGNHTYSHKKEIIYSSVYNFKQELEGTNSFIYEVTGKKVKLFRPPYGSNVIKSPDYVEALNNYKVIMWNIDSMDSRTKNITSKQILKNVISSVRNKKVAIILFHVGKNKESTLKALPGVIKYLRDNNFIIKAIDETTEL